MFLINSGFPRNPWDRHDLAGRDEGDCQFLQFRGMVGLL